MNRSDEGLPWMTREPLVSSSDRWVVGSDFAFGERGALEVARDLLGALLISDIGGERVAGVIVETEAYLDARDPASHAATKRPTPRNRIMYGPAGIAYVYRSYGVHWCLNVVTGPVGQAEAVLIRGIDVLEGEALARERRDARTPVAAGPGRLCQAFHVDLEMNGHRLAHAPLRVSEGWRVADSRVETSGRIGVRLARSWPLRYFVRGASGVSSGPHEAGDARFTPLS